MERAFAYNNGAPIPGTDQIGDLAIGTPDSGFAGSGLKWWNGPDEDLGYVIAKPNPSGSHIGADSEAAYLGFHRSLEKTEGSLISLVESLYGQTFITGSAAKSWLNSNGYWTSFVTLGPSLLAELDASNLGSYPAEGSLWLDLIGSNNGYLQVGSGSISYSTVNGGEFLLSGGNGTVIRFSNTEDLSLGTSGYKTYVLWFKSSNTLFGSFKSTIMNKMSSANNKNGFYIGWNSGNRIAINTTGTYLQKEYLTANSFNKGQWYMLTFVCKISSDLNSTKFYINGSLEVQGEHGTDTINDTEELLLGNYGAGVGNATALIGGISELAVYEGELDSSSVSTIFDNTKSRFGY